MSMMNLSISTFRPYHSPRWSQLKHHFNDWQRYARSRHELMNVSDRTLRGLLTLRRGARSVEAVLDGMIDRECEY
jgi:uncharacterized protein YjiS (DUF1127 family)